MEAARALVINTVSAFDARKFVAVQFITFCLVGVLNTAVDLSVYVVLTRLFSLESLTLAKAAAYVTATLGSFLINRRVTFARRTPIRFAEVVQFYSTVGLGIFVNVGVHYVVVHIFGLNDIFAAFAAAGATALWGFAFAKWYVFKN